MGPTTVVKKPQPWLPIMFGVIIGALMFGDIEGPIRWFYGAMALISALLMNAPEPKDDGDEPVEQVDTRILKL